MEDDQELMLITDDTIFYTVGLHQNRIISTEYFAKRHLPADSPALEEFITNQYQGYTVSANQLNNHFANNLAGKPNRYGLCLENLSAGHNPLNISTGVSHIRWMVLNAILGEQELKNAIAEVFEHMLSGDFGCRFINKK